MTAPTHLPCPVCKAPVKIIARQPQPHRHLANHWPELGRLCPGAGMAVESAGQHGVNKVNIGQHR